MNGWPTKKLSEVCRPRQWPTLSKADMISTGVPVYGANGIIGYTDEPTHVSPTILIGCRGSCGTVHRLQPPAYANGNAMALDDLRSDIVHLSFLEQFLKYRGFDDVTTGASQPQIVQRNLNEIEIPVPPLDEQKRIAAILDLADELRSKRQSAIDRLSQLGQAIFHEMFGVRLRLEKADATIGMVSERVTKGESPKWQGHSYVDEGALFVTSENVGWGVMLEKTPKFVPLGFHEGKISRSKLKQGDLLINLVGASIGRACIFHSDHSDANINQAVAVVTLKKKYPITDYLLTYILSPAGQEQILGSRVEGARANISLKDVRDFRFHLPSEAELKWFSTAKRTLSAISSEADSALMQSTSLFSSLQHRAFRGEL